MELTGDMLLAAPREKVWLALNDTDILSRCIPGCEEITRVSDTETHARVVIKVGPVRARFVGKILMDDIVPGESCTLKFEGSGGAAGFAKGHSRVRLADQPDGATQLQYTANASVGGKLGQIGARMIDASARQMAEIFFRNLQGCLAPAQAPSEAPVASAEAVASPASSVPPASARPAPAPRPSTVAPAVVTTAAAAAGESVRILWFLLGSASTGFGVWLASHFIR